MPRQLLEQDAGGNDADAALNHALLDDAAGVGGKQIGAAILGIGEVGGWHWEEIEDGVSVEVDDVEATPHSFNAMKRDPIETR